MPIFATGKAEIKYIGKFNTTDDIENEMMSVRWSYSSFNTKYQSLNKRKCPAVRNVFQNWF
jgi:hypothetical protein